MTRSRFPSRPRPGPSTELPLGAIIALHGNMVTGWAYDPVRPDLRLAVEVYLDHACVALVRADQPQEREHADVPLAGDGAHGFSCLLNQSSLTGNPMIRARLANQGPWLAGRLELVDDAAPAPPTGQVQYLGGLRLSGWLYDRTNWDKPQTVRVREGQTLIAELCADQPHPALHDSPRPDRGFQLDLPWTLADGCPHQLEVETETGRPLPGSPVVLLETTETFGRLLRRHWSGATDSPSFRLLQALADEQQRKCPVPVGFRHYSDWYGLHQQARPEVPLPSTRPATAVLLYAEGDGGQEASRASILAQHLKPAQVACVTDASLLDGLRHLLACGAEAVMLLRAGDRLAPAAIAELLAAIFSPDAGRPQAAWAYADCDRDGPEGRRGDPWFKPAWDPDLFFGTDLISTGGIFLAPILRAAVERLAAIAAARGPGARHWLLAAVVAATESAGAPVVHLPRVLYHRAAESETRPRAADASRGPALRWLAGQLAPGARVEPLPGTDGMHRVVWPLPARLPRVSLIVPTRDQQALLSTCIEGLLNDTDYPDLEIIVVDNDSSCPDTLAYLNDLSARGLHVMRYPHPFNYAAINNAAVDHASGELIGLINNDIRVLHRDWLLAMVRELSRSGIGAVGAKLLWPNGMVQHAGVTVGINGLAAHIGNRWLDTDPGYLGFNQLTRRLSAVTAACLMLPRRLYQDLGGMDADAFPVAFNDVDLCLRIRRQGLAIVWTPAARLEHAESASRGKDERPEQVARARREQRMLLERWGNQYPVDPYYHPALNHDWLHGPYAGLLGAPHPLEPRLSGSVSEYLSPEGPAGSEAAR